MKLEQFLNGCICLKPFYYRGYQQQDAHEFMHYLLDRVHTELLLSPKCYGSTETIITGIFGGILLSEVCKM